MDMRHGDILNIFYIKLIRNQITIRIYFKKCLTDGS